MNINTISLTTTLNSVIEDHSTYVGSDEKAATNTTFFTGHVQTKIRAAYGNDIEHVSDSELKQICNELHDKVELEIQKCEAKNYTRNYIKKVIYNTIETLGKQFINNIKGDLKWKS